MKKVFLFTVAAFLFVLLLVAPSMAWQGRMGGMGDPYGLIADESDFLIHPAKITKGEGVKFYGDYRFNYTGVLDWDYDLDVFNTSGTLTAFYHFDTSGQEYKHNSLLGTTFPLGAGRMGFFLTYDGMRGDYDGDEASLATSNFAEYDLKSRLDNFALRLLYGLPVGGFKLGGEAQFAYRQEKNETLWQGLTGVTETYTNQFMGPLQSYSNLSPFMFPYDSSYWEALFKGSLEGAIGPLDVELTMRGGLIFGGDNQLKYNAAVGPPVFYAYDLDGGVDGWRAGGELWIRYPVSKTLSLPLLVRIDYQQKTRDGAGTGTGVMYGNYKYQNKEKGLEVEVGGGLDKELNQSTRIAAGIYYSYLDQQNSFKVLWTPTGFWQTDNHSDYPAATEHRIRLSLAGEQQLSPAVTLRLGINGFYGLMRDDLKYAYTTSNPDVFTYDTSLDGHHWGIGASVGGSIKFQRFILEPFVTAGYEELALDGDGNLVPSAGLPLVYEMDLNRRAWFIGGGFSVLFGL